MVVMVTVFLALVVRFCAYSTYGKAIFVNTELAKVLVYYGCAARAQWLRNFLKVTRQSTSSEIPHISGGSTALPGSMMLMVTVFLALVVRFCAHRTYGATIFVNTTGVDNTTCWTGGEELPCKDLDLALEGARKLNSTVVFTDQCECNDERVDVASTQGPTVFLQSQTCPEVWVIPRNDSQQCDCGSDLSGRVYCNSTMGALGILDCYCMTYDESMENVIVGACIYNCDNVSTQMTHDSVYHYLPNNSSELNKIMCEPFNRAGQLCGQCQEGYGTPLYSYDLRCIKCSGTHYHWLLYIVVAYVPLTLFLLLVLCCRISATSAKLNAFVTVAQIIAIPANLRVVLHASKQAYLPLIQILATLFGIWNLDFFRTVIPPICMNLSTLQALSLDYATAFYPLLLLILAYLFIELHARAFWPIVQLWRPFQRCCGNRWDIRSSIINAFATFLLLTYVKLLSASFDLLTPTHIFDAHGNKRGLFLYYDGSVEFLGNEHLPYAILAVIVTLFLVLFPLLLFILYPMRCFQKCLTYFNLRWHALRVFMDAFQGCYKDGTDGSCDCRCFAAVYQFFKVTLFFVYAGTLSNLFYAIGTVGLLLLAMLIVIVQPYKKKFTTYNTTDTVLILLLAAWYASILCLNVSQMKSLEFVTISLIFALLTAILPLFYILVVIIHWLYIAVCVNRSN